MASIIRIKRSVDSAEPFTLKTGELAYSSLATSKALFIGIGLPIDSAGTAPNIAKIGGEYLTALVADSDGITQSNRLLLVGDSRNIDHLRIEKQLVIPTGTTAERPAGNGEQGNIRFNTSDQTFEGYDGNVWGSLGGVKDVDQNTFIRAELTPGSNNNELDFFTDSIFRMQITDSGQIVAAPGYIPDSVQSLATKTYVDNVLAGAPTDGLWNDGAYKHFVDSNKVVDVLDGLNEAINNVRNNVFVRDLTFTSVPVAAGAGFTATLTFVNDGNPNRYDINWGDGTIDSAVTASNPTHVYSDPLQSPATVTVRAFNTGAVGTGSEATKVNTDYITIYTPDPDAEFELYRDSAGGSALTGNNVYVVEGQNLYLKNNTTNTNVANKLGQATVAYTFNWGDGAAVDNIAGDSAVGGVLNSQRLSHTWGASTTSGNSRDTLTLSLTSHSTANPALLPVTETSLLKVYDPNISAPAGLSTKTFQYNNSVSGNPYLAHNFTDNTTGAVITSGNPVDRTVSNSGNIITTVTNGLARTNIGGTLSALVNGAADGQVTFDSSSNAGTFTSLVVNENSDYNLFDATGQSTSFATSIYHPELYQGFKASIAKAASGIVTGLHSYQLSHSVTGNSNKIEFVKDDLTDAPEIAGGTIAQTNGGNFRFISGIPYYNDGSPSFGVSNLTIVKYIGQTYLNSSSILEISSGSNLEGTSQNSVNTTNFTYVQIAPSHVTAGVPNAGAGQSTPINVQNNLVLNPTSSNVRTVETVRVRARNINGYGSYHNLSEKLQVHTAAQSGISEIAINVANALGTAFDDDGIRIFDFSTDTINTPSYTSSTNFYTNSLYSESVDPGVTGTKEATLRLGKVQHDVTNYSSGFLPVGPNRSGDAGTQFFTFAFRRQVVANFNINLTSSTGVAGIFIAAPGTAIDNASTLNGWLDCGIQYNGSGIPGADTGNGGNGANGAASTGSDRILANSALSGSYTMTLGTENLTNATSNVALVRIALSANQVITSLSIS